MHSTRPSYVILSVAGGIFLMQLALYLASIVLGLAIGVLLVTNGASRVPPLVEAFAVVTVIFGGIASIVIGARISWSCASLHPMCRN
ncbi:hypothetical protein EBR66_01085 [bacterium]|nr:hypothetical protein [bacterium]